MNLQLLKF